MRETVKDLVLIFGGLALALWGLLSLVETFSHTRTWQDRLAVSFGFAIGAVGMSLLYRWWKTRP